jgi:hypothetical protein
MQKPSLVIRLHPNLLHKSRREIAKWLFFTEKLANDFSWIIILRPASKINSYSLLHKCAGVITVGSTIGVEAAYLEKRRI